MRTFIFITGAPGAGKSTVAAILQRRLGTPLFEFGWIPEFQGVRTADRDALLAEACFTA